MPLAGCKFFVAGDDAKVAELADAPDLGSGGETLGGSTPPFRTDIPSAPRLPIHLTT